MAARTRHMVTCFLVLDWKAAFRTELDTAVHSILGKTTRPTVTSRVGVLATVTIAFPERLATNTSVRATGTTCDHVPIAAVVMLFRGNEALTFVIVAVHTEGTRGLKFKSPAFVHCHLFGREYLLHMVMA